MDSVQILGIITIGASIALWLVSVFIVSRKNRIAYTEKIRQAAKRWERNNGN